MMKRTVTWIGCLVAMALAMPAQAGGVIIDGWEAQSLCEGTCTVRTNRNDDDDDGQEIYLLAAMVFNGHAAAAETEGAHLDADDLRGDATADDSEIVVDDPNIPAAILDDIEGQELGGCAAAPGGLAALAGLLLLRRRRR